VSSLVFVFWRCELLESLFAFFLFNSTSFLIAPPRGPRHRRRWLPLPSHDHTGVPRSSPLIFVFQDHSCEEPLVLIDESHCVVGRPFDILKLRLPEAPPIPSGLRFRVLSLLVRLADFLDTLSQYDQLLLFFEKL